MRSAIGAAGPTATRRKVEAQIASLYWDLAIVAYPASLAAISVAPPPASKLVMAFDLPFYPADPIAVAKRNVAAFGGFTEAQKRAIDFGTAGELFPRVAAGG